MRSGPAVRSYDFKTGKLQVAGVSEPLALSYDEYWPRFEEIVCQHLLVYEDEPRRDRDRELLAVRFKD